MNLYHRFCDWLLLFPSSQESIDRVSVRLTWLTVIIIAITTALLIAYLTGM